MINLLFVGRNQSIFLLMICFIFGLSKTTQAQTAKATYEKEAIYLRGTKYVKNGEKYPMGFLGGKILKEFEVSEAAIQEGLKYKKNRNLSIVFSLTGLGVAIAGLAAEEEAFLWTGLALSGISIPFSINSVNNMHKAIWLRNRDILR